jgi:hypothetical protein
MTTSVTIDERLTSSSLWGQKSYSGNIVLRYLGINLFKPEISLTA